jgi:hypothetical protein
MGTVMAKVYALAFLLGKQVVKGLSYRSSAKRASIEQNLVTQTDHDVLLL